MSFIAVFKIRSYTQNKNADAVVGVGSGAGAGGVSTSAKCSVGSPVCFPERQREIDRVRCEERSRYMQRWLESNGSE